MTNELQRMDLAHSAENLQQVCEQVKDSNQPHLLWTDTRMGRRQICAANVPTR